MFYGPKEKQNKSKVPHEDINEDRANLNCTERKLRGKIRLLLAPKLLTDNDSRRVHEQMHSELFFLSLRREK